MAGIGFELRKLFVGRGVIRKIRAYAYAGIICSGTMLLANLLLLGIQALAKGCGVPEHTREVLVCVVVYALFLSMMLTAVFQTFLSRYVADVLYQEQMDKVIPSLIGSSLLLMVPGGIVFGLILSTAQELTLLQKALAWVLFMQLIPVWLEMSYITAAKDYRAILKVFALGVGSALALAVALLLLDMEPIAALLMALDIGYCIMLCGFLRVLLRYFPMGSGSLFRFVGWFSQTPDLLLTGFFSLVGAFVHIIAMWFSPLGMSVSGAFRQSGTFDAAAFYAFLVTIPTNINFIVSMEVNFYTKYKQYFELIATGGTIGQISLARDGMRDVLKQEISKLTQVQVFFMVVYLVSMRYFLSSIGFTADMTAMFQIMCVGYSAYCIGNCVMLLQLYFNDRRGALISSFSLFVTNTVVSLYSIGASPLYYGIGIAAGGIVMYLVSLVQLLLYIRHVDYHVFCSQPVVNTNRTTAWIRMANRLEQHALRTQENAAAAKKTARAMEE